MLSKEKTRKPRDIIPYVIYIKRYGLDVYNEIIHSEDGNTLSQETWEKNGLYPRIGKLKIKCVCKSCGSLCYINSKAFHRKVYKIFLCKTCVPVYTTNLPEWRKKNSDAQLKIQSTPEQKLKNSIGVSKHWAENPLRREKTSKEAKERYNDPKYIEKWYKSMEKKQGSSVSGEYLHKEEWIRFDSTYELLFLIWAEKQPTIVNLRRCEFILDYIFDSKKHWYKPDFVIEDSKGVKSLVEIKSIKFKYYNKEKQIAKEIAVKQLIEYGNIDEYLFIHEDSCSSLGFVLKRATDCKFLIKKLYRLNKIKLYSAEKTLKYIGTTNENQKNNKVSI